MLSRCVVRCVSNVPAAKVRALGRVVPTPCRRLHVPRAASAAVRTTAATRRSARLRTALLVRRFASRSTASDFWKRELKILAGLAVVTFGVSVAWQYKVQTIPPDIRRMVEAAGQARIDGDIPGSIKLWKQVLNVLQAGYMSDSFHIFEAQFALGDLYELIDKPKDAMRFYLQAVDGSREMMKEMASRRQTRQQIPLKHAIALDRLAQLYHNRCLKLPTDSSDEAARKALALYNEAVEIGTEFVDNMPTDSLTKLVGARLELAGILNNRARLQLESADFDGAEADAKRVLAYCRGAEKVKMGTQKEGVEVAVQQRDREREAARSGASDAAGDEEPAHQGSSTQGAVAGGETKAKTAKKKCKHSKQQRKKKSTKKSKKKKALRDSRQSIGAVARGLLHEIRTARRDAAREAVSNAPVGSAIEE